MIRDDCFFDYPVLSEASRFTQDKLDYIRRELASCLEKSEFSDSITIITTGSYGRGEASLESDLDLFIIFDADQPVQETIPGELAMIESVVAAAVPNSAGDSGIFGVDAVMSFSDMLTNIGGQHDTNQSLTRRMLFLLEGTWLFGEKRFANYQRRLLEKYIKSSTPDYKISKFLLNDIIRYYRTIATDFEFKTSEADKEWGLRNIKLRFSRKLLYFGGIIVTAEISEQSRDGKLQQATQLFSLPILERINRLSDQEASVSEIFRIYQEFVEKISDERVRKALKKVKKSSREESQEFQELRKLGEDFSNALLNWIKIKYHDDHPIHHSLVF